MGQPGSEAADEKPILIGSSLYAVHEQTGRARFLPGHRALGAMLEYNSFLRRLPDSHVEELITTTLQRRAYHRGQLLRGAHGSMAHVVLSGCVAEETAQGGSATVRLLGAGALLGGAEVCDESLVPPTTRCLRRTDTLSLSLDRMRTLARHNPVIALAVAASIGERLQDAERVYHRAGLRPEERLAGLFVHLLRTCAVPCREFGRMIEGPTQQDLADALAVSTGTLEGALRILRAEGIVVTGYRTFRFPSEAALAEKGKVRIPSPRVTGESSQG
ncbi:MULTISPECIES: Crp/Fnr family transcriptional regulator [Streptomyces]|uniref:Crp/Fnr family transcriptional regulator n=1 Tax=Streptomyces lichenis TaxID=2306967 RepID=A0ABT0IJB6_9ACTN|nr:Crp/Fnr family transcriptional regulator [Streptomyces lichenis]MCK8681391.1 Crp/Fnr family transcriptional regulator [Streptomyces lichenis]